MLLTTVGVAICCLYNFDRGLKMVIVRSHLSRRVEARKKQEVRQQKRRQMGKGGSDLELQQVAP